MELPRAGGLVRVGLCFPSDDSLVLYCVFLQRTFFLGHVRNGRDFPQAKLAIEIDVPFLLNEHGDPHFLFHKFNESNILDNGGKNWQKLCFLANEKNSVFWQMK